MYAAKVTNVRAESLYDLEFLKWDNDVQWCSEGHKLFEGEQYEEDCPECALPSSYRKGEGGKRTWHND